jgi:hypothetical protein
MAAIEPLTRQLTLLTESSNPIDLPSDRILAEVIKN